MKTQIIKIWSNNTVDNNRKPRIEIWFDDGSNRPLFERLYENDMTLKNIFKAYNQIKDMFPGCLLVAARFDMTLKHLGDNFVLYSMLYNPKKPKKNWQLITNDMKRNNKTIIKYLIRQNII